MQNHAVELCGKDERFYDFCLWEYAPLTPLSGKIRSINLLYNSFIAAKVNDENAIAICNKIRSDIGSNKTVWGVKKTGESISWELYFYDYQRLERASSISRIIKSLKPEINCHLQFEEHKPYFMFSIDLTPSTINDHTDIDEINIYIGSVSSAVSSGISYTLNNQGLQLGNLYYFFDRKKDFDDIVAKTACSAHLELPKFNIASLLWPELIDCQTIVVANKKNNDGLYFSRVTVQQLIFFLRKCNYPKDIVSFIENNQDRLDHMLYDVGIDYVMQDGDIKIIKSAYYGVF